MTVLIFFFASFTGACSIRILKHSSEFEQLIFFAHFICFGTVNVFGCFFFLQILKQIFVEMYVLKYKNVTEFFLSMKNYFEFPIKAIAQCFLVLFLFNFPFISLLINNFNCQHRMLSLSLNS